MITWNSNEYWGWRSGTDHPTKGRVILIKRGSSKRVGEHSGQSGYQLKRRRNYANKKLVRKDYWLNHARYVRKEPITRKAA